MCAPYLEKLKPTFFPVIHKGCTFDCNSVKSLPISIIFAVPKPEKMYETGRAFTYLLVKENVANDVINVSLFAYDKITLRT